MAKEVSIGPDASNSNPSKLKSDLSRSYSMTAALTWVEWGSFEVAEPSLRHLPLRQSIVTGTPDIEVPLERTGETNQLS